MSSARRIATLVLLVVAAGSLAFATGATVLDGPADTFAEDRIAVQPADGPNGNYSYLNDDEEIVVDISATNPNLPADFEGINPGALASAEGVFTITHTADEGEPVRVWIDGSADTGDTDSETTDSVTFIANGDSIEGAENGVMLGPNESVAVGLAVDTRGEVAGTKLGPDTFSIGVDPMETAGADGSVTQSGVTDSGTGPTKTVSSPDPDRREFVASDISRDDTLRFDADGMVLDGTNVTLDRLDLEGVQRRSVELSANGRADPFDDASTLEAPTTPRSMAHLALEYNFDPDDVDEMTLRFSADARFLDGNETDPDDVTLFRQTADGDWDEIALETVDDDAAQAVGLPEDRVHFRATTDDFSAFVVAEHVPRITVADVTLAESEIEPDDAATAQVTVENRGGTDGTRAVTLTADDDTVATETVTLEAGEETTASLAATFETADEYELAVDGVPAGTLTVGDPTTGGDGAGGSASIAQGGGDDTASDAESASAPIEEPGGASITELAGLLVFIALAATGIALVRRMPG